MWKALDSSSSLKAHVVFMVWEKAGPCGPGCATFRNCETEKLDQP